MLRNSESHLQFNPCRYRRTSMNIPFNLAKNICTIFSNTNTGYTRLHQLNDTLVNRNYPPKLIHICRTTQHPYPQAFQINERFTTKTHTVHIQQNLPRKEAFGAIIHNVSLLQKGPPNKLNLPKIIHI